MTNSDSIKSLVTNRVCVNEKPLKVNDVVQVQNQRGNHAKKWDLSGKVMEVQPFDSYLIKMDSTGRLTKRNRRYLRPITPFSQPKDTLLPLQQYKNKLQRTDAHADQGFQMNNHLKGTLS